MITRLGQRAEAAGYATNPQYADRLIALIEDYKLYEYDELSPDQLLAMEEHKKVDKSKEEKKSDADKKMPPIKLPLFSTTTAFNGSGQPR